MPKRKYVVHYRNLRFYKEEGLVVYKMHRGLQFNQSSWLAPSFLKDQDIRAKAQKDLENDQAKHYNNARYGKTCENQKKRRDILLVNHAKI